MPVPVSPQKNNSARTTIETIPESSSADPIVVAGYQDCLKETLRFLVEEEHLPMEHPVVAGLTVHLTSDTAQKELEKFSQQLADTVNETKILKTSEQTVDPDSGLEESDEEDDEQVGVYQITLTEEDSSDEMELETTDDEMEMEEMLVTAKDILNNTMLRKELIRLMFQGCDLVASPNSALSSQEPHP